MMEQEKLLGILISYNPDLQNLVENIALISSQVTVLYIVDNASTNAIHIEEACKPFHNVTLIKNQTNLGLGKAYNQVLEIQNKNFDYFVTFDQDTKIAANTISKLTEVLQKNSAIGVVGPSFSRDVEPEIKNQEIIYKKGIIQSCAVFRMDVYKKIGGFNEEYFIDSIDFEYCLRILDAKLKVALYKGVVINHELGTSQKRGSIEYFSHNKLRNYYIGRNHVRISKSFFLKHPMFILKKNFFFFLHILKIIFLEKDTEKLKYLVIGMLQKPMP